MIFFQKLAAFDKGSKIWLDNRQTGLDSFSYFYSIVLKKHLMEYDKVVCFNVPLAECF